MEPGLHDNWIYAHHVNHDTGVIVLRTFYPHSQAPEYTDVIFEGVLVHHFETQRMSKGDSYPSNVLFDIEEEDASITVERYKDIIIPQKNYGWPVGGWDSLEDLARMLTANGHQSFHIHGTVGLDGFVFAKRMILRRRESKWTDNA
jgi:hypothetical protein